VLTEGNAEVVSGHRGLPANRKPSPGSANLAGKTINYLFTVFFEIRGTTVGTSNRRH
jgi:hypothetical protein